MIKKILFWLTLGLLFFLPWQTREIYEYGQLQGVTWEYTSHSLYATELLLWAVLLLAAVEIVRRRTWWPEFLQAAVSRKKYFLFCAVVALVGAIIVAKAPDQFQAYYYLFHGLEAIGLFFIMANLPKRPLFAAFWLGAMGQALLGTWQFFAQHISANKWLGLAAHSAGKLGDFVVEVNGERWLRAYGSFGSPTMLGAYLVIGLLVGFTLYEMVGQRQKIAVLVGQGSLMLGLTLTFTRGAWLALALGLAVKFFMAWRQSRAQVLLVVKQIVLCVLIFVGVVLCYRPLFTARFTATGRLENRSVTERRGQYAEAWQLWRRAPLFGIGPGQYTVALAEQKNIRAVQPVHNVYLLLLVECGLLPFALLLFVFAYIIYYRRDTDWPLIVALLALGSVEHFWWTLFTGTVLWWVTVALAKKAA